MASDVIAAIYHALQRQRDPEIHLFPGENQMVVDMITELTERYHPDMFDAVEILLIGEVLNTALENCENEIC
jgi:diacylglycerol kinase